LVVASRPALGHPRCHPPRNDGFLFVAYTAGAKQRQRIGRWFPRRHVATGDHINDLRGTPPYLIERFEREWRISVVLMARDAFRLQYWGN
jgi:hypothetical protein